MKDTKFKEIVGKFFLHVTRWSTAKNIPLNLDEFDS